MAITTGNDYDHIDIVNGSTQTRHMLKDASARADVADLKSAISDGDSNIIRSEILKNGMDIICDSGISPNILTETYTTGSINTDGSDGTSSNYKRTGFQAITPSTTLYVIRESQPYFVKIFFYTSASQNSYIDGSSAVIFQANATALTNLTGIPVPATAAYFRLSISATATGGLELSYTTPSEYQPKGSGTYTGLKDGIVTEQKLASAVSTKVAHGETAYNTANGIVDSMLKTVSVNFFDGLFPQSGYLDTDGSEKTGSNYKRTDFISIDGTKSKIYALRSNQPYQIAICFYNSSKAIIGTRSNMFTAASTELSNNKDIPENAAYIRMYTSVEGYTGTLMLSYTYQSSYVPYGGEYHLDDGTVSEDCLDSALKAKVNRSSDQPFYGKKIVMMGDSIIGNFNDETGLAAIIAAKTGATVYNCAFGGTRIAYRHSPYGDATPGATGYIDGATDAQKNNVDQYRYWNTLSGYALAQAIATGTWTAQETAVANMSGGLDYFSTRLTAMEGVTWGTIDYILWEYGTNDFSTGVVLSDTSDTTNLFAYDNAYRGAIETILTAYPNIQIIPITPLWRWYSSGSPDYTFVDDSNTHSENDYLGNGRLLPAFAEKAQAIAREYQMPCIDDYWTMGANRFTYLHFYDASDGVHPNAEGRGRIAEHIASQLDSVI